MRHGLAVGVSFRYAHRIAGSLAVAITVPVTLAIAIAVGLDFAVGAVFGLHDADADPITDAFAVAVPISLLTEWLASRRDLRLRLRNRGATGGGRRWKA